MSIEQDALDSQTGWLDRQMSDIAIFIAPQPPNIYGCGGIKRNKSATKSI